MRLVWTRDFIVIDGHMSAHAALQTLQKTSRRWVIISRGGGNYLYAFEIVEFFAWSGLPRTLPAEQRNVPIEGLIALHEEQRSTQALDRNSPPPIDRSWRPNVTTPSIERWIEVDVNGAPVAVGRSAFAADGTITSPTPAKSRNDTFRGSATSLPSAGESRGGESPDAVFKVSDRPVRADSEIEPETETDIPTTDEGTSPLRFPSIEADVTLVPGQRVQFTVDLLRQEAAHTQGGAVGIGPLLQNWTKLELTVMLSSAAIKFDDDAPRSATIFRNSKSSPAHFGGYVLASVRDGSLIEVTAAFFYGSRFCGSALRRFIAADPREAQRPVTDVAYLDTVVVEPDAEQPDVTVFIEMIDKGRPNLLRWRVEPSTRFDGLPSNLREDIDLGRDPASCAGAMFAKFPSLVRGAHRQTIEGFGDELWSKAPHMFHEAYWALYEYYKRQLTIQFICDEPNMPWELMRPTTSDEKTTHPPLALMHSVGRWIDRYRGDMRNALPGGSLVSIAPKYANPRLMLKKAQEEQENMIKNFGATALAGTRAALLGLLESDNPAPPVGILHFAGHGQFATDVAVASSIKLEDGMTLTAAEVKRKEVQLGRACRTLVFFNACEVGATGMVFGEVGGWADAFLDRGFGGFIAPLWAVEEEDSAQVAAELLESVYAQRAPIGAALRAIREKYANKSSTYFSYLYYGDVTARIGKIAS